MAYIDAINGTDVNLKHGLIGYFNAASELIFEYDSKGAVSFKDPIIDSLIFDYSNSYVKLNELSMIELDSRLRNGCLTSNIQLDHKLINGFLNEDILLSNSLKFNEIHSKNETNIRFTNTHLTIYDMETELAINNAIYTHHIDNTDIQFGHKLVKLALTDLIFSNNIKSVNIKNTITSTFDFLHYQFPGWEEGFREYAAVEFTSAIDLESLIYIDINTPLHPICSIHGEYAIMPIDIIKLETGCPKCDSQIKINTAKQNFQILHDHYKWYNIARCDNNRLP